MYLTFNSEVFLVKKLFVYEEKKRPCDTVAKQIHYSLQSESRSREPSTRAENKRSYNIDRR